MLRDKHKRKISHMVLVMSDSTDTGLKQFKIKAQTLWILIIVLCVLLGGLFGYLLYEEQIWAAVDARSDSQQEQINMLQTENEQLRQTKLELETQMNELNETVQILSETVNQKTKHENELQALLDKNSMPTEFPLDGSASMEEIENENPLCVFNASEGTTVVATASGTVIGVNDDVEFGHNVWIDHGNGYVTIYRNEADAQVSLGDTVIVGTTLFIIEEGKEKLGYQMMKDGKYIDPMEMLSING